MQRSINYLLALATLFTSCGNGEESSLAAFEVFCEMVANQAKPIALSAPMLPAELDRSWSDFQSIADQYRVELYREDAFPLSSLFPGELTAGKSVILIYQGKRLDQYLQWKADLEAAGPGAGQSEALARRLGRLLGYSPQGVNALLSKNGSYRTLSSFQVQRQITHLYYEDLPRAIDFYQNKLGLQAVRETRFKIGADALIELHATDTAHPAGQAKSTAIALLTDQLPAWYAYVQEQNIPIKYTYKPRDGGPHDGFVAIDPEGYLLEFEQFKQHPENELFITYLQAADRLPTSIRELNFYGSITWTYHQNLLLMQQFYEEVLGYSLVADQGWTKIYQTTAGGFIGLVDECRGMENYADDKAIELEWQLADAAGFSTYAEEAWQKYRYQGGAFTGPEKYRYQISGAQ